MAFYKNTLQVYTQKMHLAMPVYESVNEGLDHLPSFKCFVIVNGSRYESTGVHKHKKDAEQSAAQVAIQDLATKHSDYQFEEPIGKRQLTELLVKMGVGSPTFSSTVTGIAHSLDFTATVQIGGLSYVGGVAKSKREAETKAAFVAFQAIKEQGGDPHFQLQLQAESTGSHELRQPTKECKDIKPELKTITNSCPACNKFLDGNNPKQTENSCEMMIMKNACAVEKGPENLNANDENSVPSIEPHNQLERENFLVVLKQEESEAQKTITNSCSPCNKFLVGNNPKQTENSCEMSIMENPGAVEKGPGNLNANDENSAPSIEPHNPREQENLLILPEQEETKAQKQGVQEVILSAVEKGPGNSNANDENSAPSIKPHNPREQENLLILPEQEETEAQKQGVQEVNLSAVEKGPGNSNANDENSAPSIEPHNLHEQENLLILREQEETEAQKQGVQEVNLSAFEKGPGNSNANDENSAPSIEPHNQRAQENLLILPKWEETEAQKQGVQEVNLKDSISKRSRSDDENCEQISGKMKKEKK